MMRSGRLCTAKLSPTESPMSTESFFHEASGSVRFFVQVGEVVVGAMVGKATLHYRYHADQSNDDPLATYRENEAAIDDAVRRRVANGSIEPIMLRDADIAARIP